jgi:hypothetical protein
MLAIAVTQIPRFARLARSTAIASRNTDYVLAARALGAGNSRMLTRHILPNSMAPLMVQSTLLLGTAVIETAALEGDIYFSFQSGGAYSDQAAVVERYRIEQDPRRLVLEMTVTDPVTLLEPHVIAKTWLHTPDVQLLTDSCGDIPGKP